MKRITIVVAVLSILMFGQACTETNKEMKTIKNTEEKEQYTFKLNDNVTRKAVTFKNRYGITVSGDLYTPKNAGDQKLAAIILSGPFGAVKEQSSGLYANEMAARGFVTLAFDPSTPGIVVTGDSAGGHLAEAAATLSPLIGDPGFGVNSGVYQYMPTYLPKRKSVVTVRNEIISAIKAVAPSYGASEAADFSTLLEQKDPGYWDAISPTRHVPNISQRSLPHFMVRGTKDPIV